MSLKRNVAGCNEDELRVMLSHKADRDELRQIAEWKANKHDFEQ